MAGKPDIAAAALQDPAAFRDARRRLRLSAQGMAEELGVGSGRTVRKWESAEREIPGPAARLVAAWIDPRCPPWLRPEPSPRYAEGED